MNPFSCRQGPLGGWLTLCLGLLVYLGAQGYLTVSPLRNWTLTPEVDDTLTYVLKSQQMRECFFQDCPALLDLREQLYPRAWDSVPPEVSRQRLFALSRVFPIYHLLFSALLLGLSSFGPSLMEAYRWLWTLAPLIFGASFAVFLTVLLGPGVAGIALFLLAFKVFPDTGLHHLVPSNFTMALAMLLFARMVVCRGWAPFSLLGGSLILMAMHLVGVIYAVMAGALAFVLAEPRDRRRLLWLAGILAVVIIALMVTARVVKKPSFIMPPLFPGGEEALRQFFQGAGRNFLQILVENVKLMEGLWGLPPLFLGAVALGLMSLEDQRRPVVLKFLGTYGLFLFALIFYVSNHPADVFFRVWIPFVVLLFGLVGQAFRFTIIATRRCWQEAGASPELKEKGKISHWWPLALLAVLVGYAGDMILKGADQIQAMAQYLRAKEPLALYPSQPELLLSRARPGDRVLYTSVIVMDYYFIHGALRLGAVYYHPLLAGSARLTPWLQREDLRFVVGYHPTVYHPAFEGLDESRCWPTVPEFRFSPLSEARRHGPLAREGKIPAHLYRWLDITPRSSPLSETLHLCLENPGQASVVEVVFLDPAGHPAESSRQLLAVPRKWQGRLALSLASMPPSGSLRLGFPRGEDRFFLTGIRFGEDPLNWPWAQKARLTFYPREGGWPIPVSFDPVELLPEPLKGRAVTVLDDRGSSVLLELGPKEGP